MKNPRLKFETEVHLLAQLTAAVIVSDDCAEQPVQRAAWLLDQIYTEVEERQRNDKNEDFLAT